MSLLILNNEQKMIQNEVRKFAGSVLEPISSEIDKNNVIPGEIFKKLNELGMLYALVPSTNGGAGLDAISHCIILEEISRSSASLAAVLVVNNILGVFLSDPSIDEERKRLLNFAAGGEIVGLATEPQFDAKAETPEAGGAIVLNAHYADRIILSLADDEGRAYFLLPVKTAGVRLEKISTLGLRAAGLMSLDTRSLNAGTGMPIKKVRTPDNFAERFHGDLKMGFAAVLLGVAQAGLDASIKYAKARRQFGRPIGEFYLVREMLAEMKIRIEAARNLVYDGARCQDCRERSAAAINIAFVSAGETAVFCGLKAIQVHGGYGYTTDYPVERCLRDAKTIQNILTTPFDLKDEIAAELLS